jgi:hypothetical protein
MTNVFGGLTVKHEYNDHPTDPIMVAVVDRCSLFRGRLYFKSANWDLKIVVAVDRWSLFRSTLP